MALDTKKNALLQMIKILKKGIAMERNAHNFYTTAALRTKSEAGRRMFEWLAQFEISHKARLEGKLTELLNNPVLKNENISDLGEYEVSEADLGAVLPPDPTDIDVLKVGLENEKRAYAFYQKKITFSQDPAIKTIFEQLAKEEVRHIQIINDQISDLKFRNKWKDMQEMDEYIRKMTDKEF